MSSPDFQLDEDFVTIAPTQPIAPWFGGKRILAKRIIPMIDAIPHRIYAEPFVGMGGIFFLRTRKPLDEVINDLSDDVANLFRCLHHHYVALLDMMRFQLSSRSEFQRLLKTDPCTLTDLQRAARFLYLQRLAFSGKVIDKSFAILTGGARFNVTLLVTALEAVHERLSGVVIEHLDWRAFIPRYDRPHTLFYLAPPYWGLEGEYGPSMFAPSDFQALADTLALLKGRFILSINDAPEIREIFGAFTIETATTHYTISPGHAGTPRAELLISNPPKGPPDKI